MSLHRNFSIILAPVWYAMVARSLQELILWKLIQKVTYSNS